MERRNCEGWVRREGRWSGHYCANNGTLEHEGHWYCKTHHKPTQDAKKAAAPKCQYRWVNHYPIKGDRARCNSIIKPDNHPKYCTWHLKSIQQDIDRKKIEAYDKVEVLYNSSTVSEDALRDIIMEAQETLNPL